MTNEEVRELMRQERLEAAAARAKARSDRMRAGVKSEWCRGADGPVAGNQGGAHWNNTAVCPTCGKRVQLTKNNRTPRHKPPKGV
jgi:hypothetical protein